MSISPNQDNPYKGLHISIRCGFCGDKTSAEVRGYTDERAGEQNHPTSNSFILVRCLTCDQGNLLRVCSDYKVGYAISNQGLRNRFGSIIQHRRQWPKVKLPVIPSGMPEKVITEFLEAEKLFIDRYYSPAAIQFRKTLELAVKDMEAEGNNLYAKIENLETERKISPDLKEWAHEVRIIGNKSVHDERPDADTVKKDAEDIRYFAELFLTYVYTLPKRIEERRATEAEAVTADE